MRFLLAILLLLTLSFTKAQNLVPNPSFEDTIQCPIINGYLSYTQNWESYSSSPDYYHACSPNWSGWSVPNNYAGHQMASSGQSYIGAISYVENETNYNQNREIIGCQLISPLSIGVKYYGSFRVCHIPFNMNIGSNMAINKLGMLFSTVPYSNIDSTTIPPIENFAHIYTNTIITDTVNWTKISGSFIADSAYSHLSVGNFFESDSTDTLHVGGFAFANGAYYLFDDICVSTDSLECYNFVSIKEQTEEELFTLFPNPTNGLVNIALKEITPVNLTLYNAMGQMVFSKNYASTNTIQLDLQYPKGIYFLKVETPNETFTKKLIKN